MRSNLLFWIIFLAGLGVLGAYWWSVTRPEAAVAPAEPVEIVAGSPDDPVLVIEVAGEAEGQIEIQLFADLAPAHVDRIVSLAEDGKYDGVVFHRVIDGFMAQSGDVQFGRDGGDLSRAGMGGSELPDLQQEFSTVPFERGVVGMARSQNPDSANSQFFIMFAPAPHLNRQYTVVGQVISGLPVLDAIKRGDGPNGAILGQPDKMKKVTVRH